NDADPKSVVAQRVRFPANAEVARKTIVLYEQQNLRSDVHQSSRTERGGQGSGDAQSVACFREEAPHDQLRICRTRSSRVATDRARLAQLERTALSTSHRKGELRTLRERGNRIRVDDAPRSCACVETKLLGPLGYRHVDTGGHW